MFSPLIQASREKEEVDKLDQNLGNLGPPAIIGTANFIFKVFIKCSHNESSQDFYQEYYWLF